MSANEREVSNLHEAHEQLVREHSRQIQVTRDAHEQQMNDHKALIGYGAIVIDICCTLQRLCWIYFVKIFF